MEKNCNIKIDGVNLKVLKLLWACAERAQIIIEKDGMAAAEKYLKGLVECRHPDGDVFVGLSKEETAEFFEFVMPYYRDKTEGLKNFIEQYGCMNFCCERDWICIWGKAEVCNGLKIYNGVTPYTNCIAYVNKPTISEKEYKWYKNDEDAEHLKLQGIGVLIIGEKVDVIGKYAFQANQDLKQVIFEPRENKIRIHLGAFLDCSRLAELINFPSNTEFVVEKHDDPKKHAVFGHTSIKTFEYKDTMKITGDSYCRVDKLEWIASCVEKKKILIIHGWMHSADRYKRLKEDMEKYGLCQVTIHELPGFGNTPPEKYIGLMNYHC